jgi:hypothetical protein
LTCIAQGADVKMCVGDTVSGLYDNVHKAEINSFATHMKFTTLTPAQRNVLATALCKYGKEAGLRYVGDHIGFSYQEWLDSEAPAMIRMGSCTDKALGYLDALCVQPDITINKLLQVLQASTFAAIMQDATLAFLIVCLRCTTRSLSAVG